MNDVFSPTFAAFALVCLILLVLPFVPAFREWQWPTDATALPVAAAYAADIDHFARRLKADADARMGEGMPTGFEEFEVVEASPGEGDWAAGGKRLLSLRGVESAGPIRSTQPVYVEGNLRAGKGSALTAVYAAGDMRLGPSTQVSDWAHADGAMYFGEGCTALRRVSADVSIELAGGCWFERLEAPEIRFGDGTQAPRLGLPPTEPAPLDKIPGAVRQSPLLVLVRGDCALEAGKRYEGSLVVTGFLTIGAGAVLAGDVKARKGLSVGPGAHVLGAITCEKRIYMFPGSVARGPLICESDVLLGSGAVVGAPDAPTTVSANNMVVEEGVIAYGAVWAHEVGMVRVA
ncbi:MAG: polymer-forming cytoskeletal protein [Burkholderiaceae bacterium]